MENLKYYIGTGLKVFIMPEKDIRVLIGLYNYPSLHYGVESGSDNRTWYSDRESIVPILYPLSSKEITVGGETFDWKETLFSSPDYCEAWGDWIGHVYDYSGKEGEVNISSCPIGIIEKMIEWHLDVFGWIDQGKAIDVSKLDINPYE